MKYCKNQFEILVKVLKIFKKYVPIEQMPIHSLHFVVYQQFIEGQEHNAIYLENGKLIRRHAVENINNAKRVIDFKYDFKLYPDGCHDSHITTAMNKALKLLS